MINYLAVIVAAIASFVVGFIWYHTSVFGKTWMKLVGLTKKDLKKAKKQGMGKTMSIAFIAQLVMAYVLAYAIKFTQATTIKAAATIGFWLWLGFIAPVLLSTVLWEKKPVKLYLINAAHWLVALAVMAGVLAWFG